MKRTDPRLFLHLIRLLPFLLLAQGSAFADVTAELSRSTTSLDEPVRLRLQIKGENDASPDLSVLRKDFEILGRSQQQSVTIINGQMSKTHGLILTLLPKQSGKIIIPPIPVGSEQSAPLTLEVIEAPVQSELTTESGTFIQLELNKTEAYLQEEVILTARLYLSEGVRGESMSEPQPSLPDTLVGLLNEEQYQAEHEGQSYRVVERRYAIFAYQTGSLTLGEITFRGHTGGSGGRSIFNLLRDPFTSPGRERQIVRAQSEQVEIKILPVPQAFTGNRWLPARNLQIMESGLNSAGALTAGKPATRHIMLFADGLTAAQLPPIELELPEGIKQYPERPQNRDNLTRGGISGSRQSGVILVATGPGSYDLPAIEIPWWNTETNRQEVARLPAITLQVMPGLPGSTPSASPQALAQQPFEAADMPSAMTMDTPPVRPETEQSVFSNWLVWVLAGGWLATLAGWWLSRRAKQPPVSPAPAERPVETEPQDELSEITAALDAAYQAMDPESARMAWLRWGQYRWPDNPPSNLNRLAARCPQKVARVVLALDRAIYSPGHRDDWGGILPHELLQPGKRVGQRSRQTEKLIPLNP